jgi:ABC-type antimicrobial peptide transport system permease subunit
MSETSFPVNDLLRRKFQTTIVTASVTLCVASTLFLLLFTDRMGFGLSLTVEGKLTSGFSIILSPFLIFLGILILVAGAVILSFLVYMMMFQRVRDIGLMKAAGCPNDLIFGYFFTQLIIVALFGCILGTVFGILADFVSASILNSSGLQILQGPVNLWFVLLIFVLFFVLALVFGAKPIVDATKVAPVKAISPAFYIGLGKQPGFRVISKSGFAAKIALRSLFRHKSATIRIILCLSVIFLLVAVSIAGGVIADQTTKSWVEKAIGRNIVLIGHQDVCDQYKLLLSRFYEANNGSQFDYTAERYSIPESLLANLRATLGNVTIDSRLVLEAPVREVQGYMLEGETGQTQAVGDNRRGESLIVGIEPEEVLSKWFLEGKPLTQDHAFDIMVGDTLAQKMFSQPLVQGMRLFNETFEVVGVCMDPINNGNVTYVPIKTLENATGVSGPNVVMVEVNHTADQPQILSQVRSVVSAVNPDFQVFELNEILDKSLGFLGYIWSTIMFLPLFSLATASLCLIGYVMLAIGEQQQELGVLRAVGAKPGTLVNIISIQSLVVLLSSYAVGVAFGIIITLLVLMEEPLVTSYTVLEVAGWLLIGLTATFISSLYPAIRFARKPILDIISQP